MSETKFRGQSFFFFASFFFCTQKKKEGSQGQFHKKRVDLPAALRPDAALVGQDDGLGDREPQAVALVHGPGGVGAVEALEDVGALLTGQRLTAGSRREDAAPPAPPPEVQDRKSVV